MRMTQVNKTKPAVFNDIFGILDVEWKKPDDPIQSVIGKVGFFSDSGK